MNALLEASYYAQSLLNLELNPQGIVYAGAHTGEHIPIFQLVGFANILAIEPNAIAFSTLSRHQSHNVRCICVALGDKCGRVDYFDIAGVPTLNSTLEPDLDYFRNVGVGGDELHCEKKEVEVRRLDDLLRESELTYNALYMNIQGGELSAIAGARESLSRMDLVITECNFRSRYRGCPLFNELDPALEHAGFTLMQLRKYLWSGAEHGEAWYLSRRHIARHASASSTTIEATGLG